MISGMTLWLPLYFDPQLPNMLGYAKKELDCTITYMWKIRFYKFYILFCYGMHIQHSEPTSNCKWQIKLNEPAWGHGSVTSSHPTVCPFPLWKQNLESEEVFFSEEQGVPEAVCPTAQVKHINQAIQLCKTFRPCWSICAYYCYRWHWLCRYRWPDCIHLCIEYSLFQAHGSLDSSPHICKTQNANHTHAWVKKIAPTSL